MIVSDLSKYVYYLITRYLFSFKAQNILETIFVLTRVLHMLWLFFWISMISEISHKSVSKTLSNSLTQYDYETNYQL
jgi:hypothetical protein